MINYYALEVNEENENEILEVLQSDVFNNIILDSFILKKKQYMKFVTDQGFYEIDILKGTIFFSTNDINQFKEIFKKCKALFKLNEGHKFKLHNLKEDDLIFLDKWTSRIIDSSLGTITKGKLTIESGPLVGKEKMIKKIDRHKKIAYLSFKFSFSDKLINLGLDVPVKTL